MNNLASYLPQDRRRALASGQNLPDRAHGSVLFADISGFTPFTEALRHAYGPRRGAEELTNHLDTVYTALIGRVQQYGGSVIGFAGDAITCWFDDGDRDGASRAVACGLAMQEAMQAFASTPLADNKEVSLRLKVAIATGAVRRLVVGDEAYGYLDTLAGETVNRTAVGEHLAQRGEIIIDQATAHALGDKLALHEWRTDPDTEANYGVVKTLTAEVTMPPELELLPLAPKQLRPWLHPTLYEREQADTAVFLAEFRPCVALFIRFTGLDYDSDHAGMQLDSFVQAVQRLAAQYEGTLLHLIIGDKGSYLYLNFGALSAHEDEARRAIKTATAVREISPNYAWLNPLQMGLAQGVMWTGTYGGATRRTYSAFGDEVNLAARLMQAAVGNEILVSGRVHTAVRHDFTLEPHAPLVMKGKAQPVPVFAVMGESQRRAIRLQEPSYTLPMVGRVAELRLIEDKLELAAQGQSQIIGIVAEAGMGKSRLVAEVIRTARKKGFVGYGGACQSDALHTPYHAWKSIWQAFFAVDSTQPLRKIIRHLAGEIEDRAPERVEAMPLLNVVLDLPIPENEFTQNLEPKIRQSALHALLEDCLKAAVQDEPLLIVIEDMHWIDALSHDLLEQLAKTLSNYAVCFVLAYRPPQLARLEVPRLEALPQFAKIELHELTPAEAESAIRAKLAQLYPARSGALPIGLAETLMARAQGNPFYLEELLNYVRDRGLDTADINNIDLPDSLHALILSRIDQLSEQEKTTLRVASIVGRRFRAPWLLGYYPALGAFPTVKTSLDELASLDITPLDTPEPEFAYLFKHIVTHEVTYESLPFATRAKLHELLASYLETVGADVDTIAYHYGQSDNTMKKRHYFQKAAEAALGVSAYITALEYLTRLLDLTPHDDHGRSAIALQLAETHKFLGDFSAARTAIAQAQASAITDTDHASALALLGEMTSDLGDYAEAQTILAQAVPLARASGDLLALCKAQMALGTNEWVLGKLDEAKVALNESLTLARTLGNVTYELFALTRLGLVAINQGNLAEAEQLYTEVHQRAMAVGNRERAMVALNNLGAVADERHDTVATQRYIQQSLALAREIGAQQTIALGLINLASCDIELGQLAVARAGLREGLTLALQLGALPWVVAAVKIFANLAHAEGQTERALALKGLARNHSAWSIEDERGLGVALAQWGLDAAVVEAGLARGATLNWETTIQDLLTP